MMSSFTTLKKNSRFKSACPSSGPVTFSEGSPGHVHIRSPRGLTRGFLHQPCARIYSRIASTCPSSGPATFCEGSRPRLRTQSGHVHIRSRRVHARSFRCTNLCNFLSASVGIFAAAVRLYSAAPLWVSGRHPTLSWASSASGSLPAVPQVSRHQTSTLGHFTFGRMHQRPPPLIPRQPLPLELSHGFPASAATSTDAAPAATSAGASAFSRLEPSSGRPTCSARWATERAVYHQVNFIVRFVVATLIG